MPRAVLLGLLAGMACSPGTPARTVSLRMTGAPAEARVTIDDQLVGPLSLVAARGVALPPGQHRITVEAPGHFPWDRMVDAREGEKLIRLEVALVPIPE